MALDALVNGEKVKSWTYSDEEWQSLRAAQRSGDVEITMSCCPQVRAVLRAGSRIQHFAHKAVPANCNWKPKSKEHERLQYIIARVCHEAGWEADIEVQREGYIADVLALKDDRFVAFEVQITRRPLKEIMDRHQKYIDDDVKDVWLFKKLPASYDHRQHYKYLYSFRWEDDKVLVDSRKGERTLESFIKYFLRYKVDSDKYATRYVPEDYTPINLPWWQELLLISSPFIVFGGFIAWIYHLSQPKRKKRR